MKLILNRVGKDYHNNRLLAFRKFDAGVMKGVYTLQKEDAIVITVVWE